MRWKLFGMAGTVLLVAFAAGRPVQGSTIEVQLKLPQKARLDLKGKRSIAVAPFQVETQEDTQRFQGRDIDVQKEFERYLVKVIRRETELKVIETGALDLPVTDFEQLAKQTDFWLALGERTGADLLLSGGLDFDVQDKTGYRTEEYVSPFNGQTYYRQVLVEQTGFEYDILMQVYDAKSGTLVYQDNFKDFQKFEGESTDPLRGMFENLLSLEDKIVGVFTQKEVETTRTLFTD